MTSSVVLGGILGGVLAGSHAHTHAHRGIVKHSFIKLIEVRQRGVNEIGQVSKRHRDDSNVFSTERLHDVLTNVHLCHTCTCCKVRLPSRWAHARESIFTKLAISSPDSFTSRMKSVVGPNTSCLGIVSIRDLFDSKSLHVHFTIT